VDVKDLIAELRGLVEKARSMPMSASAVINRREALDLVDRLEQALPTAFADQDKLFAERDEVLAQAHRQAAEVLAAAQRRREELAGETDLLELAQQQADSVRAAAAAEAERFRREADDYVDTRLATFEVTLTKILEAVSRGRARLHGQTDFDALAGPAEGSDQAG
jgi:hypothetical protein